MLDERRHKMTEEQTTHYGPDPVDECPEVDSEALSLSLRLVRHFAERINYLRKEIDYYELEYLRLTGRHYVPGSAFAIEDPFNKDGGMNENEEI